MHEVSLMEQTLATAIEQAQARQAQQIHHLTLRVGKQSGVVPEALRFAFDVVIQGSIADHATLTIEEVPVTCRCRQCQQVFQPESWVYECPSCGSLQQTVTDGKQLELASIEMG